MNTNLVVGLTLLFAGSLTAAELTPKDEVIAAARKLDEKANYSWKMNVVVPESARFKPGPTDGKTEKDGVAYFTVSFGNNTTQIYLKGDKSAVSGPDGDWRSAAELEGDEGPGRFLAFIVRNFKAPAAQVSELVGTAKELTKDGDVYSGEMSEAGAKSQFKFGDPTGAKGSVKFWIKDGQLSKYQFKLTGKVDFNGNEIDVDRDSTVEIKDVGTTKLEVPAEAKKKLEPAPTPEVKPAIQDSRIR